jgi:hypothetical protein
MALDFPKTIRCAPDEAPPKRGPKTKYPGATAKERNAAAQAAKREQKRLAALDSILVLDFETDPFEAETEAEVYPFLADLYGEDIGHVIFQDEDYHALINRLANYIRNLPGKRIIYAHNGGRFDFRFLLSQMRGEVSFKGNSLMKGQIGEHELRDSYHIIPEKLSRLGSKIEIDYLKMKKAVRQKHMPEIIEYCKMDCEVLHGVVKHFIDRNGMKISIGQASMALLRNEYKPKKLGQHTDAVLRNFFHGGRVECIQGAGRFVAPEGRRWQWYDINSAYPDAMANGEHPIGDMEDYVWRTIDARPNADTCFLTLECDNRGALLATDPDTYELTAHIPHGVFKTTIWEYNAAIELGLISNVRFIMAVDCPLRTNFSRFVLPQYAERQELKAQLDTLTEGTAYYTDVFRESNLIKLYLNNAYGKFAQDPRKFKDAYITSPGEAPPPDERDIEDKLFKREGKARKGWGSMPTQENELYWVWERPSGRLRFNNVGTAASITGYVRAKLLHAIANAESPLYCDTDSLCCLSLANTPFHATELGAWKPEAEFSEVLIAGKKIYGARLAGSPAKPKIKCKGAALTWDELSRIVDGETVATVASGVTIDKSGAQYYIKRNIRATVRTRKAN